MLLMLLKIVVFCMEKILEDVASSWNKLYSGCHFGSKHFAVHFQKSFPAYGLSVVVSLTQSLLWICNLGLKFWGMSLKVKDQSAKFWFLGLKAKDRKVPSVEAWP